MQTFFTQSDLSPNITPEENPGFEGPEKRIEVNFHPNPEKPEGLRIYTRDEWQEMLDLVKCTIVSHTANSFLDSFVLSESSLFVYPTKIVLKTCGTTTLLNCLDKLEDMGTNCGLELSHVLFSRKNFNFPEKQIYPHCNFEMESSILKNKFGGSAHILGPVYSGLDHFYLFFSEPTESTINQTPKKIRPTLEIVMSELNADVMSNFYRNEKFIDAKTTTKEIGLAILFPEITTDEVMFNPCGYSVNGISRRDGSYFTVHVTPEPQCSFVSFETDADCEPALVVQEIIDMFKPGRFSVLMTSQSSLETLASNYEEFSCRHKALHQYKEGFNVFTMNCSRSQISSRH